MNKLTDAYNAMVEAVVPERMPKILAIDREDADCMDAHNTCRSHVATTLPKAHKEWVEALRRQVFGKMNIVCMKDSPAAHENKALHEIVRLIDEHLDQIEV